MLLRIHVFYIIYYALLHLIMKNISKRVPEKYIRKLYIKKYFTAIGSLSINNLIEKYNSTIKVRRL